MEPSRGEATAGARTYDMGLRDRQSAETRRRIVGALVDLINTGDGRPETITVPDVADRAGVSVPTVYRHFKTKDALFEAITTIAFQEFTGDPELPTLDTLPAALHQMFAQMRKHEGFVRATLATDYGREMRRRRRPDRDAMLRSVLDSAARDLPEDRYHALYILIQMLTSGPTYLYLTDKGGYDSDQAADVASWAIRTLIAQAVAETPDQDHPFLRRRPRAVQNQELR